MRKLVQLAVLISFVVLLVGMATVAYAQTDVTAPTDPLLIVNGVNDGDANSGAPPANEQPARAIDNQTQKYLNFLDLGSGFIVTPALGATAGGTIITGARFYTANDAPERDPASYIIEGGLAPAGPWTIISQDALALPTARNASVTPPAGIPIDVAVHAHQEVTFANTAAFTSYRVTFPTLRNAATANSMQIGEVELLGAVIPEPSSVMLLAMGLIGLVGLANRRKQS